MPTLKVLLLGPPAVYYDDTPLNIQRRTLRTLLYYLAEQENRIDRSQLILALWPDDDELTGRRRLREILSKLRAELPDPDLLVTGQDQIGLDRSRLSVDALLFDALFKEVSPIVNTIPRHMPLPERTHQQIREAVDLWRAPYFMAGAQMPESETLDRWMSETARILERRRVMLIDRQSDHYAASGDIELAVSWLSRILDEDPYNEDWQVRYLSWLQQLNRRSEAATYSDFLIQQYKARDEQLPARLKALANFAQNNAVEKETTENPLWPPPTLLQTAFVGRIGEMQQLSGAYQRGGVVILWGESGSGKTRLLYEFSQQHAAGSRLLVGRGHPSMQALPYQPLLEMLRQSVSKKEWAALPVSSIIPLMPLIPELSQYVRQTSRVEDTQMINAQGMIFEAIHQVLKSLARQARLIIALDDAHNSDRTTLDALAYLVGHGFFERYGLLVVTARPDEQSPGMDEFLEHVRKPSYRYEEIFISDMTQTDASALMTLMLGRSYPGETIRQLLEISNGRPLHLIETLRSVLEYSAWMDLEEVIGHLPMPKSIQELVQRRMRTISSNALRVLQAAAVAGEGFRPAMLENALELDPEEVVNALEELEKQRFIEPGRLGLTGPSYHFLYSRIRNVVLADLSEARKRILHLSVAKAMKTLPFESRNPSMIASHFEEAGEMKEAFDYWVLAGVRAREVFSRAEAEQAFLKASALLQYLGSFASDQEIYNLYSVWGDFLDNLADYKVSLDLFYSLQGLGNQRRSHILLGAAFNGLSRTFRNLGEYEKALQYNRQAEVHLETTRFMPEYFMLYTRRALIYCLLEDYEKSDEAIKKAVELAAGDQSWRIQIGLTSTFLQLADISNYKGLFRRTIELCEMGERSIETTYNNPDVQMIRLKKAQAHNLLGFPRLSYELSNEVLKLGLEWNHKRLEGFAKQSRAQAAFELGRLGECLKDIEDALEISAQYNYMDLAQQTYCLLGDFYLVFGEYQQSEQAHLKGMENSTRLYYWLDNEIRRGNILIRLKKEKEGFGILNRGLEEAQKDGFSHIQNSALFLLGSSLLRAGEISQAEEIIRRFNQSVSEGATPRWTTEAHLLNAFLGWKKGTLQEVETHIEAARCLCKGKRHHLAGIVWA